MKPTRKPKTRKPFKLPETNQTINHAEWFIPEHELMDMCCTRKISHDGKTDTWTVKRRGSNGEWVTTQLK